APPGGSVAPGEGTTAIPQHDCPAQRAGEGAAFPPYVQDLASAAEDGGDDARVAGREPGRGRAEPSAVVQRGGADLLAQRVEAHGDHDLRAVATIVGQLPALHGQLADRDEGVGATLGGGGQVDAAATGPTQRIQRGVDDGGIVVGEPTGHAHSSV